MPSPVQGASIIHFARGLVARDYFDKSDLFEFAWQQVKFRLTGKENMNDVASGRDKALSFVQGRSTEELRRLPDETIDDLHRAGLFRILQPKRVGGSELPFRSMVELVSIIGTGDGSTAWVLANLAAHHWMLAMFPKQAQDEVWGQSPDNLIGSALTFPRGRAHRVENGYRLSGRWPFSSGVDPSAWNLLGAIMQDEDGQILEAHSISAGLDYPGTGPEHAYLRDTGRARYVGITDDEALNAFRRLAELEGIIPALESAHAVAWALGPGAAEATAETVDLICLSGRGDKDLAEALDKLGLT